MPWHIIILSLTTSKITSSVAHNVWCDWSNTRHFINVFIFYFYFFLRCPHFRDSFSFQWKTLRHFLFSEFTKPGFIHNASLIRIHDTPACVCVCTHLHSVSSPALKVSPCQRTYMSHCNVLLSVSFLSHFYISVLLHFIIHYTYVSTSLIALKTQAPALLTQASPCISCV